jgi:DUF4097 and DUF4098 domain-containing protein YvlB
MTRHLLTLSLLACLAAPAAWAATPINQTRPLDPRGRIEIENLKGRIQVRVWDKAEVRISGSLGAGVEKLVVEGDRGDLLVRVQYPKRTGGGWGDSKSEPTDLRLDVPRFAELEIESVSADVDVVGTAASSLQIDSVSGDVVVAGAPRQAAIESVSGDLRVTVNSPDVHVESVSGDITLRGKLSGEVHTESVSGDISIDNNRLSLRRLATATVSGDANVHVGLMNGGSIKSESVSGEINLVLPKSLSARVMGESFSGDLNAPGAEIHKPKYGPGSSFEHRYGNGSGDIRIESFSGDVDLKLE